MENNTVATEQINQMAEQREKVYDKIVDIFRKIEPSYAGLAVKVSFKSTNEFEIDPETKNITVTENSKASALGAVIFEVGGDRKEAIVVITSNTEISGKVGYNIRRENSRYSDSYYINSSNPTLMAMNDLFTAIKDYTEINRQITAAKIISAMEPVGGSGYCKS